MAISNDGCSETTNRVQARFLSLIETEGKWEFDSRDIDRVRNNTEYVSRFVKQMGGDENKAYNMLSCICQGIVDMGLAFPRGVDRDGNVVVILNVQFHRRDNFQSIQLQQFVVYCLETHKFINDWMASQNRDLKVMTNRMGNPEAERRAEFYSQHWTKEAVTRYFYTKVQQRRSELEQALGIKHT